MINFKLYSKTDYNIGEELKRLISGIMLTVLLFSVLSLASNIRPTKAEPKTWIVDDDGPADFHTIQEAINAANPQDTIYVRAGVYYENIVVNKTVSLIGVDKDTTIIDGRAGGNVISIIANQVTVSGFTIQMGKSGVSIQSNNNTIYGNRITNNSDGGVCIILGSANNVVHSNEIKNNGGVDVRFGDGVYIESSNNFIVGNTVTNNRRGGVVVVGSYNYILENNVIGNSWGGPYPGGLGFFSGISVTYCHHVEIVGNNIANNKLHGLYIYSNFDKIFHNNFVNNTIQFIVESGGGYGYYNVWDDGYPSGGNYWSDYSGTDLYSGPYQNESSFDWIGDSPYIIDETNRDNYPLMDPYDSEAHKVQIAYRNLLKEYNRLLFDFNDLNSTYYLTVLNYTELLENFHSLQTSYNTLDKEYESTMRELSRVRNQMYIFVFTAFTATAVTILLIARQLKIKKGANRER